MGQSDYYLHGSSNVICDRCGFKYKRDDLAKEWTGLMTCRGGNTNNCWEPRHPQDFVRGRKDDQNPPWVRPEAADTFLNRTLPFVTAFTPALVSAGVYGWNMNGIYGTTYLEIEAASLIYATSAGIFRIKGLDNTKIEFQDSLVVTLEGFGSDIDLPWVDGTSDYRVTGRTDITNWVIARDGVAIQTTIARAT